MKSLACVVLLAPLLSLLELLAVKRLGVLRLEPPGGEGSLRWQVPLIVACSPERFLVSTPLPQPDMKSLACVILLPSTPRAFCMSGRELAVCLVWHRYSSVLHLQLVHPPDSLCLI